MLGPPGDRIRDAIMRSFTKAFPDISLEFTGARGGELATKIKAERDAGIYSVDIIISGTSTADAYFKPMKALAPIEPALDLARSDRSPRIGATIASNFPIAQPVSIWSLPRRTMCR